MQGSEEPTQPLCGCEGSQPSHGPEADTRLSWSLRSPAMDLDGSPRCQEQKPPSSPRGLKPSKLTALPQCTLGSARFQPGGVWEKQGRAFPGLLLCSSHGRKREFKEFSPSRDVCFSPLDHCILKYCTPKVVISGANSTDAKYWTCISVLLD